TGATHGGHTFPTRPPHGPRSRVAVRPPGARAMLRRVGTRAGAGGGAAAPAGGPSFGALLRRERLARGLTPEALAERARRRGRAAGAGGRGLTGPPRRAPPRVRAGAGGLPPGARPALVPAPRRAPRPPRGGAPPDPGRHTLPLPPTSFVGRERELGEVA